MELSNQDQETLSQAEKLASLANSQGWQEVLKPWLESKIAHSWVDPREFKSEDEFMYAYRTAWGFSRAADEIVKFVEERNPSIIEALKKKMEGKDKTFRI